MKSFILAVACLLTVVAAMVVRSPVMPRGAVRWTALWSGVFGGIASVLYLLGIQADVLPAAVTGAMFPAVSVALGLFRVQQTVAIAVGSMYTERGKNQPDHEENKEATQASFPVKPVFHNPRMYLTY